MNSTPRRGSLHVGHVFSFTQSDVIVRYQRMCGRNIYYPMGWDDNGLPTERRVQSYFHVRVDPNAPPAEIAEPTPAEKERAPRRVSRPTFIELCHRVTRADERAFQTLFTQLALSVDWRETYATIDDASRRLAQLSFLDLYAKAEVYSADAPTLWDLDFQTAIAQAEVEDRVHAGAMHELMFAVSSVIPLVPIIRPRAVTRAVVAMPRINRSTYQAPGIGHDDTAWPSACSNYSAAQTTSAAVIACDR